MKPLIDPRIEAFQQKSQKPLLSAIVWNNGELFESSYGMEKDSSIDVFEIGSNGKTFTTTLLATLIQNKIVNLDDPVSRFRPDLPFAKAITLKQLATHTSGLPPNPLKWHKVLGRGAIDSILNFNSDQFEDYLSGIEKLPKPKSPKYSNLGMALLGNLLAGCLNQTYEQAVKELVLEPLGMLETHASVEKYDDTRLVKGHSANGRPTPHFTWESMEPAGVWFSTPSDIMIFLKAYLGHSGDKWKNVLKITTEPVANYSKQLSIGLGWILFESEEVGRICFHNGGTFGQLSTFACALEKDIAIALFSNRRERFWHPFLTSYQIDAMAIDILEILGEYNVSQTNNT
ncbi:MAG: beta-lactamase family protein [Pseudomonadales bacterium]|nr:beta-lactamase family protein [Pseudomonadales bacterium]